jgi:steroid delta-isomerase-like uncharacterized protein
MSVVNKAVVRRLYEEAFGQGKPEVLEEVLNPDFVCYDPNAEGGEVRGLETIKGEIEYFQNAFPEDFFWRVEDQLAEGDKVTTRYTLGGTHQGEFFGIPASGRRGEIRGINIDRVEGGKVVEEWASYDLLGAMHQLGTIPDPGQEEARAPEEEREEKGLMDKAKGRIKEAGGTKDNVRDELDETAGRGRRDREDRKEAAPEEVGKPGSGGVKDNVQDEWAETQERR